MTLLKASKRRLSRALLIICGLALPFSTLTAAKPSIPNRSIIEELILRGDYDRAIGNLLPIEIESPSEKEKLGAALLGARLYELVGKEKTSVRLLERFRERNPKLSKEGLASVRSEQFRLLLRENEIDAARKLQESEPSLAQYSPQLIYDARLPDDSVAANPVLAAALSTVLPGAGQIYQQRYKDALSSVFMISIPALFAVAAKRRHEDTFAASMATVAGFFYLGNIASSYRTASLTNQRRREKWWRAHVNSIVTPQFRNGIRNLGLSLEVEKAIQ